MTCKFRRFETSTKHLRSIDVKADITWVQKVIHTVLVNSRGTTNICLVWHATLETFSCIRYCTHSCRVSDSPPPVSSSVPTQSGLYDRDVISTDSTIGVNDNKIVFGICIPFVTGTRIEYASADLGTFGVRKWII